MNVEIGFKFHKLTVVDIRSRSKKLCLVQCECGASKWVRKDHLTRSDSPVKSCGCSRWNGKHGMTHTREYSIWLGMKQRCLNENYTQYSDYGGRGITICDEWFDFSVFFKDMGKCPAGYTLDRKDNLLGYSLENCRWSTRKQQQRNTRRNRIVKAFGESLCLSEWAEKSGVNYQTISSRLDNGWSAEEAIFKKTKPS